MKRLVVCLTLLSSLGLMLSVAPGPARAEVLLNERIPVSVTFFDECTGESIQITGEFHIMASLTTTVDGRVRRHAHANLHGTGIGLTTGNEYVINDNLKIREVTDPAACGFKYEDIERIRLISKGALPNQTTIVGLRLFQNQNCQLDSEVTAETDCRG